MASDQIPSIYPIGTSVEYNGKKGVITGVCYIVKMDTPIEPYQGAIQSYDSNGQTHALVTSSIEVTNIIKSITYNVVRPPVITKIIS